MEHPTYRSEEHSIGDRAAELADHLRWVETTGAQLLKSRMPLSMEGRQSLAEGVKILARLMPIHEVTVDFWSAAIRRLTADVASDLKEITMPDLKKSTPSGMSVPNWWIQESPPAQMYGLLYGLLSLRLGYAKIGELATGCIDHFIAPFGAIELQLDPPGRGGHRWVSWFNEIAVLVLNNPLYPPGIAFWRKDCLRKIESMIVAA